MNPDTGLSAALSLLPGDHVIYPRHGAGVVRAVTERIVAGEPRPYYDIQLRSGGMQMLVPVEKAQALGLRRMLAADQVEVLFELIRGDDIVLPEAFQARFRQEQSILEGGEVLDIARLAATLARRHVHRGLAASELALLEQAKRAVSVELAVALELDEAEAARLFEERLA